MKSLRISRLACLFVGLLTLTLVPRAAADCDQLLKAPGIMYRRKPSERHDAYRKPYTR